MVDAPLWLWIAFNLFVLLLLALDIGVFHRKSHAVSWREATAWSAVWVALALLFNLGLYLFRGAEPAIQFLTGYLIEKSLSVDNLFVFALVFGAFKVPAAYQHRVLVWGVLGALVFRAILIVSGTALLHAFEGAVYVFGAFLVLTGIRMAWQRESEPDLEKNFLLRLFRRSGSVLPEYREDRFTVRENGRRLFTPLFLVLLVVESTDLLFALDSIPAILAVTDDPFLVYTSNVFAILGLRSLYFLLAAGLGKLVHLKLGLAAILVFIGTKMTLTDLYPIPTGVSLAVTAGLLAIAVATSLWSTRGGLEGKTSA
jgi:tellurite resistance protein TerC